MRWGAGEEVVTRTMRKGAQVTGLSQPSTAAGVHDRGLRNPADRPRGTAAPPQPPRSARNRV